MTDSEISPKILKAEDLQLLLDRLIEDGYEVLGPTKKNGTISFQQIDSVNDFPIGIRDIQCPGQYSLETREEPLWFGYSHAVSPLKRWLMPPHRQIWRISKDGGKLNIEESRECVPKYAFIGLRACDLQSIRVLDRVLLDGQHRDVDYETRRKGAFMVAVNCSSPSQVCFCASMGSGPRAKAGYDLCLTEFLDEKGHWFLAEIGSHAGLKRIEGLPLKEATEEQIMARDRQLDRTEKAITKQLTTSGLQQAIYQNPESPVWSEVARRCLACGNCTLSCPTCFCCNYVDSTDRDAGTFERSKVWDSCFHTDFSYIHGGSVRRTTSSRYRQWLTHKLASWQEQFQMEGCVGCGRCITWCPAGIDLTEEAKAVAAGPAPGRKHP